MSADSIQAKLGSNAKAAKLLHKHWTKSEREQARRVGVASLATKIGELRRGKTEWWAKREVPTRLLADMLGCGVEDLLGRASIPAGALVFPEFPGLPPLRLEEATCRIDRHGWLRELVLDGLQQGAKVWITAGHGMGKSQVIRWLKHHAEEACAGSVRTLAAAETLRDARPLVLEVDEPDPDSDPAALRELARRASATVVLAPHRRPDAARAGAPLSADGSGWQDIELPFTAEARERLLRWTDQRLESGDGDTRLILDDALDLLRRTDPNVRLVASPGDLLALCADLHEYGVDSVTWETRACRWLRAIGPRLLPADFPSSWAPLLERTYLSLCAAAVTRSEHAWGPVTADDWMTMLPDEVCGPAKEGPGRAMIIEALRAAGLLRAANGGLVLSPTWVRDGLAGAVVDRAIDEDAPERWGLSAADPSRQHLVDDALDRCGDSAFRATVRAVVVTGPRPTLGQVAAFEAVFAAAARRLDRGDFRVTAAELDGWHRLVELQIASMLRLDEVCWPFTRRGTAAGDAFLAHSWTLSLGLPAPEVFDHDDLAWRFPGWFGELVIPAKRGRWPWLGDEADELRRRMVVQSFEVLSRVSEIPPDSDLPPLLLPAAIILASARGWTITQKMMSMLLGSWEEWALVRLASERSDDERAAIAELLWEVAPFAYGATAPAPVTMRLAWLRNGAKHLLPFILDNLSEESLRKTIERDGAHRGSGEIRDLKVFPRRLRRVLVQATIAGARAPERAWLQARELVGILDREDIALAIELIGESDVNTAAEFTGLVWSWSPRQAHEEAARALAEGRASARAWFHTAPRHALVALAGLLDEVPRPFDQWVAEWARNRVLEAGPASEVLFALAGAIGENEGVDQR